MQDSHCCPYNHYQCLSVDQWHCHCYLRLFPAVYPQPQYQHYILHCTAPVSLLLMSPMPSRYLAQHLQTKQGITEQDNILGYVSSTKIHLAKTEVHVSIIVIANCLF